MTNLKAVEPGQNTPFWKQLVVDGRVTAGVVVWGGCRAIYYLGNKGDQGQGACAAAGAIMAEVLEMCAAKGKHKDFAEKQAAAGVEGQDAVAALAQVAAKVGHPALGSGAKQEGSAGDGSEPAPAAELTTPTTA